MIVTLMISTICARLRIQTDVHRASHSFCSRHTHNKNFMSVKFFNIDHSISDDVCANLLSIVNHVPKIFTQFLSINTLSL